MSDGMLIVGIVLLVPIIIEVKEFLRKKFPKEEDMGEN